MDKFKQIKLPEFILCENPVKTGDFIDDNRQFIYVVNCLSLIEIIPLDDYQIPYDYEMKHNEFTYTSEKYQEEESFMLVFVQNNVEFVSDVSEIEILQGKSEKVTDVEILEKAWTFYENYLKWEDSQN